MCMYEKHVCIMCNRTNGVCGEEFREEKSIRFVPLHLGGSLEAPRCKLCRDVAASRAILGHMMFCVACWCDNVLLRHAS